MRGEDLARMKACLAELDPDDREIIRLVDYESLGYEEVSARLGISVNAAMKRRSRAVDRLRELMDAGPEPER